MKKSILAIGLLLVTLLCAGCMGRDSLPIEQIDWEMTVVQESEQGNIVAVSAMEQEKYSHTHAKVLNLTCSFTGMDFVITDVDSGKSWRGTCSEIEKGLRQDTIYEAVYEDGSKGLASSGITTYADGSEEGTLIFTSEEYSITFRGDLPNAEG